MFNPIKTIKTNAIGVILYIIIRASCQFVVELVLKLSCLISCVGSFFINLGTWNLNPACRHNQHAGSCQARGRPSVAGVDFGGVRRPRGVQRLVQKSINQISSLI